MVPPLAYDDLANLLTLALARRLLITADNHVVEFVRVDSKVGRVEVRKAMGLVDGVMTWETVYVDGRDLRDFPEREP